MQLPVDVYIRVSRVGKRENLISPDEQERRAREHARQHNLTIGRVLQPDLDESGGKLNRPGLNEALRRVETGESGGVIVAWLDRLSRDSEHAHGLVRRITEAGGAIYAPDAPADWTSPEGELQAGFVFLLATYVRKRARAGFESAKKQAIERGIPVVTRPAVGYRRRADRRLEADPKTAPVVRTVFERRSAGAGPTELARVLERRGVRTSQGSRTWSKQAVYNLLSNRVYLGELAYGRDRRYVNEHAHEPIVDLALWTAAQHPNGRRLAAVGENTAWLLAGLLRCHACRYSMQGTTTSRGDRIYRCTQRHAAGICPSPARVRADPVERAVVDAFWRVSADLAALGTQGAHEHLPALVDVEQNARRRLEQVSTAEAQDALGDQYLAVFRERREAHHQALAELGAARAIPAGEVVEVEILRNAWERMSTRDRRDLLGLRFDTIALRRDPLVAVIYLTGSGPVDLPRRGFKTAPVLAPFPDAPADARTLPLEPLLKPVRDRGV